MQLTKDFHIDEFACKDGTAVPTHLIPNVRKLAQNLQVIRDEIGKPIYINSGYRTPQHNKKVGGVSSSRHLTAEAGDLRVDGMRAIELHKVILKLIKEKKIHNGGLGLYNYFVHYDVRPTPKRWDLRT